MTEPHGINSVIMILGIITGFTLLFWGSRLERYVGFVRNALAFSFSGVFIISFAFQADWLIEILQGAKGFLGLWQGLSATSTTLQTVIKVSIALLGIILGIYMHLRSPRASAFFAMLIVYLLFLGMPAIEGWIPYTILALQIGAAILALCLSILRNVNSQTFAAVETAVFGGCLISYLFTTFYYLPYFIFIAFAVILCSSGMLIQIHSQKKRARERRIMTGEEST